jgi:glycosyltransferase involved in cell wall biosynthesis
VIRNGVDTGRFRPDPAARSRVRAELCIEGDAVVACLVARVDAMKDHAGFLEAFRSVTGARAILVGEGTRQLATDDPVVALGRRSDVPDLLAASDIVVSSSAFGEGLSNAIAEGMATGLAAVATDVGDSRELVGPAGLIVPPRAPAQLAAAMQTLVDNPDLRREFGLRARQRIEEEFSLSACVQQFMDLYRSFDVADGDQAE